MILEATEEEVMWKTVLQVQQKAACVRLQYSIHVILTGAREQPCYADSSKQNISDCFPPMKQ